MDTNYFKEKLEAEKALLEGELKGFAVKNSNNPNDWDAVPAETTEFDTRDEIADRLEDLSERQATEGPLESQLARVNAALEMIAAGTYGICVVCHKEIEDDRLHANPSSKTCKDHLDQE